MTQNSSSSKGDGVAEVAVILFKFFFRLVIVATFVLLSRTSSSDWDSILT